MPALQTETPVWLKHALLGVCFWMGHRRALYREYPLGESAMVAELCNLLFANLPNEMKLVCEVQYSKFLKLTESETEFTERSRVDLCICGPLKKGTDPLDKVAFALEVKRGSALRTSIENDLRRLYQMKAAQPHIRAFLLLISERKRPAPYVTPRSFASKRKFQIEDSEGHCRVRAVMKAVPAITKLDNAHYACAIEVLLPDDA
jgi:hypothetical protein